jgi:RND family efflux transporter MFP subunit
LEQLRINREVTVRRTGGSAGRIWILVLLLLAVFGAAAAAWYARENRAPEVATTVASVSGGTSGAAGNITANGYVVARTKASVAPKVPGRLAYLGVSEGSHVRRGEIIARLENADYTAALSAAHASAGQIAVNLSDARTKLARAQTLAKQNLLARQELDNAITSVRSLEAQLRTALAEVQVAEANLENTNVRAPFDGTVLRKDAEVGEIVAPSTGGGGGLTRTAIVTMADLATLEVEVDVNEAYIAQVRNGEPARITLDAYPDTSFAGRVRQVVPTADREKATVQVKVSILDRDPRILPEMGAKVEFVPDETSASAATAPHRVTVAKDAIVGSGTSTRVWIVEKDKVMSRAVTIGRTRGEDVEVVAGLTGGEVVVVRPPANLAEGAKVRIARPATQ